MLRLLGIVIVATAASVSAQATHVIRGTVAETGGGVLPGVVVTVTSAIRTASAVTNAKGQYEIAGLPDGKYSMSPKLGGFHALDRDVTVTGRDEIIDLVLRYGGPPVPSNDPRRLLLDYAEARWNTHALKNYEFRIDVKCFCMIPSVRPWLRVVNGVPVPPDGVDERAKSFFSHYNTAEKLFAIIRGALDRGGHLVVVTYDEDTGFPLNASLDPQRGTSDDEMDFRVELKRGGV